MGGTNETRQTIFYKRFALISRFHPYAKHFCQL